MARPTVLGVLVAVPLLLLTGCSTTTAGPASSPVTPAGTSSAGPATGSSAPVVTPSTTSAPMPPATVPPSAAATSGPPPGRTTRGPVRQTGRWHPRPGTTWQWQLSGTLDLTVDAQVYDVDLFTTSAAQVAALHRAGRRVVCYLDAGSYEPDRPDSGRFPAAVLGSVMDGWPDERWLDVRRLDVLEPLLAARLDLCRSKGFDGVEPDNVDGYGNDTGFPLTAADQLRFNRRIAALAHARGLAVGLKNDLEQVPQLVGSFDFAVNEQCAQYDECGTLAPFVAAGKAVFHAEYDLTTTQFCATSRRLRLSSLRKRLELGAWRQTC
jgi:hypothetical protein